MNRIGTSDLLVFPLCLGGNVFGWTSDEAQSFATLDAFVAGGGNFIDTADMYSSWVPGHVGGESETILGRWMKSRGNRARIVLATKVGKLTGFNNLAANTIRTASGNSLKRLQTDHIDLYYAHADDPTTPLEETLTAFDGLVREGKVRYIAASNYTAPRLAEALAVSKREGLACYVALQPHYNLVHRHEYEGDLMDLCAREGLSCAPYFSLARGFLTGKYRPGVTVSSPRSAGASTYLNERGLRVLAALDDIAASRSTTIAAVGLAWLRSRPTVVAPIAGAGSPGQIAELLPMATLELSFDELRRLTDAWAN
jgi:aryl-alcohol dehydrogenase-like predicted oxidoreductase